jgi:hypothetical protein
LSRQYPVAGFGIIGVEVWFLSLHSYSSPLKIEATFPPKRRLTFNGLHSVIPQKVELFITTTVRTSDHTVSRNNGIQVVSLTRRLPFIPQEDSWYSFLLVD